MQLAGAKFAKEVLVDVAGRLVVEGCLGADVGSIGVGVIDGIYGLGEGIAFTLDEHLDEIGGDVFDHKAEFLGGDVHCHSLRSFEMARGVQKAYW